MAAKTFKMTATGKAELEKELEVLKTEGRIDIAENLRLPVLTATFPKTANMMRQSPSRLKSRLELTSLNISLIMPKLSMLRMQMPFQSAKSNR